MPYWCRAHIPYSFLSLAVTTVVELDKLESYKIQELHLLTTYPSVCMDGVIYASYCSVGTIL